MKRPDARKRKESHATPAASCGRIYAGSSGWAYASWKPGFYPAEIRARRFLEFYSQQLNTVEVNYTFRKLPSAGMLAGWIDAVPADFRFSFKAPQRITHFRRLVDCGEAVAEFVSALEPVRKAGKLGPLLFQLPPNFKADAARLKAFLSAPALRGRKRLRVAFEFRHQSWFNEEIYAILGARGAALCIAESESLRTPEADWAGDFSYYRLRRPGGYSARKIAVLARRIGAISSSKDVFIYFKHEDEPAGALNAVALRRAFARTAGKR